MQRKSFSDMQCPIARGLEHVGEWWSILILRDAFRRERYNDRPPRDRYVLTQCGKDFRPVMLAMLAYGNKHFPPDDRQVRIVNADTGQVVEPVLVDPATGRRVDGPGYQVVTTMLREAAA